MTAFYNEIEPHAAAWLRELIDGGHIAPGIVDERDIRDILPSELAGFTQCHFFAGIGVWSYALRLAGWPDERPVWTGSCPCQPFSAAGKGAGFDDERHLWPAWHHLIRERGPAILFGEQVASSDAGPWIDLVQDDLEAVGYTFGAVPFPAAGVGAPHIRDRLYFVADAGGQRLYKQRLRLRGADSAGRHAPDRVEADGRGKARLMADTELHDRPGRSSEAHGDGAVELDRRRDAGILGDSERDRLRIRRRSATDLADESGNGPLRGFWSDADWIACRDGKSRAVEPSTFPLAHGAPARVVRLRGYGNAINAEAARVFIEACNWRDIKTTSGSGMTEAATE